MHHASAWIEGEMIEIWLHHTDKQWLLVADIAQGIREGKINKIGIFGQS
jgi:hypothetical protein